MSVTYDQILTAVLAMDAYNRSDNQGVNVGEPSYQILGQQLGDLKIIAVSDKADNDNTSFYAIAWQYISGPQAGSIVISYRGTDNPPVDGPSGWGAAAGLVENTQANLAIEFYETVLNKIPGYEHKTVWDEAPNNLYLTGHSLGGGLAGYVASLSQAHAIVFDHMPFEVMSLVTYAHEVARRISASFEASSTLWITSADPNERYHQVLAKLATNPDLTDAYRYVVPPPLPNWLGNVLAYHVDGEALQALRDGSLLASVQDAATTAAEWFGSNGVELGAAIAGAIAGTAAFYGQAFEQLDSSVPNTALSVYGWNPPGGSLQDKINLHSQALQVILMQGELEGKTKWQNADVVQPLLDGLYDDSVGAAVGMQKGETGAVNESDQMARMIAYSAIQSGTTIFGNTAVHAFWNDSDDLAEAIASSATASSVAKSLGQIIAQYAGQLAYGKVSDSSDALSGALSLNGDKTLLSVSFADSKWNIPGTNPDHYIVGRDAIIDGFVGGSAGIASDYLEAFSWLWNTKNTAIVDKFNFALGSDPLNETLPDATAGQVGSQTAVTMTVASDYDDILTGSNGNDFVVGGLGDDTLIGSLGNDLLAGGSGNDTYIAGMGKTVFVGGEGDDTANFGNFSSVSVTMLDEFVDVSHGNAPGEDRLAGVETIILTEESDSVHISKLNGSDTKIRIEAGGQAMGGTDLLDFSDLNTGVVIGDGGTARQVTSLDALPIIAFGETNSTFTGFEYIKGSHYGDVYQDRATTGIKVVLGDGADTVKAAGVGTTIDLGTTGNNTDKVWWNPAVQITNFGKEDRLSIAGGIELHGGMGLFDSKYAYGLGGLVAYGIGSDGSLIVRVAGIKASNVEGDAAYDMFIAGWASSYGNIGMGKYTGNGDITLFRYQITASRLLDIKPGMGTITAIFDAIGPAFKTVFGHGAGFGGIDPIVLDLDGDGFDLNVLSSASPYFDLDSDLYKERSGWVGADDGMLVRDIGADGKIEDSRELFGGNTSGFALLAALDGNGDGVVDVGDDGLADFNGDGIVNSDDHFSSLKIWQDSNQNGISDQGELKSLSTYNIAGLSLTSVTANDDIGGNKIVLTGSFIRADGSTSLMGEALLASDNKNTVYSGPAITLSPESQGIPDLSGSGTLVSLRQAATYSPSVVAAINTALGTFDIAHVDLATLREDIRPLLTAWAAGSPFRDGTGQIVTGADGSLVHGDLSVIKDNESVSDYSWNVRSQSLAINGQAQNFYSFGYVSGLEIILTADENPSTIFDNWGQPESQGSAVASVGGVDQTVTRYTFSNGQSLYVLTNGTKQSSITLQTLLNGQIDTNDGHHYSTREVASSDISFFERFLGEKLPLEVQPEDSAGALATVTQILKAMEQNLDLLAVRVAVQSDAFSSIFTGLSYDVESSTFKATSNDQLTPTFANLIIASQSQSDPVAWLKTWGPMLDILIGAFDRGDGLLNTNGFLAQNIVAAYEQINPTFSLIDAATGFGLEADLFVSDSANMIGSNDADILYLHGTSGQTASGGQGLDNYIVGSRFGHSTINDIEPALSAHDDDVVRFTDLNPDDVTVRRDGTDLIITAVSTGDTLTIKEQFFGEWAGPFGGGYWADKGVGQIVFKDGTTWNEIDMARAASHPDAASTTVTGTADNDFLDGGAGDDRLVGGGDGDIYVFGLAYGHDVIAELEDNPFRNGVDILTFRSGVSVGDLNFSRVGNSSDLVISIKGTSDDVVVEGQFNATYTGVFGTLFSQQIELFTFEDGGILTADQIDQMILDKLSTSGNDTIYGFSREDTLDGGAGDDFLSGGNENDTYVFGRGYGHDTILEGGDNLLGGMTDTVRFKSDILVSDVVFSRDGSDLIVTIAGSGDVLRIVNQYVIIETGPFGAQNFNLVENFSFSDGTTLGWRAIMSQIIQNAQTPGDDHIAGTHFDDIFDGGTGDDLIEGADGADTYKFGRGDGKDIVHDEVSNPLANDGDTIAFKTGITIADLRLERTGDGNDLKISLANSDDTLTIQGQFIYSTINFRANEVENFTFADGTSLTSSDIRNLYIQQQETSGDDVIGGFETDDTLEGAAGNDTLAGGDGNDTYVFKPGFGQDIIHESVRYVTYDDNDRIVFGAGLSSQDVSLKRVNDDLIIKFNGTTDQITIQSQFSRLAYFDSWTDIERIEFADGTVWTDADIRVRVIQESQTSGDDVISGYWTADDFDGGAGNDTIYGGGGGDTYHFGRGDGQDTIDAAIGMVYSDYPDTLAFKAGVGFDDVTFNQDGNDLLISINGTTDSVRVKNQFFISYDAIENFSFTDGTALTSEDVAAIIAGTSATVGNDRLIGTGGADTLQGLGGADILKGLGGSDTYVYNLGDGADTIFEAGHAADTDLVQFGAGIAPSQITIHRSGLTGATLSIAGQADQITLDNQFKLDGSGIEQLNFVDGTSWNAADIRNAYLSSVETTGADTIWGFDGINDTLQGFLGDDVLTGGTGSDTYVINAGDGADRVTEGAAVGDVDKVVFGAGLNAPGLTFSRTGALDLVLTFAGAVTSVTLTDQFALTDGAGVEQITFGDGTSWTKAQIFEQYLQSQATSGDQEIFGANDRNDYLYGGGGNDSLQGQTGSDTYYYNAGDGNDSIFDAYESLSTDVLKLGAGLTAAAIHIGRTATNSMTLTFDGQAGSVYVNGEFDGGSGVERIDFADGISWSTADLRANYLLANQTSGNDTVYGFDTVATIFNTGLGDDYIYSGQASDTILYNLGDGNDTIASPMSSADVDTLAFGAGITTGNIRLARSDVRGLTVSFAGSAGSINILGQFSYGTSVDQFTFADGTLWSLADIRSAYLAQTQTSGNDVIYGFDDINDTLQGGQGDDVYLSSTGDDTYVYGLGDGHDTINEGWNNNSGDKLKFSNLNASDVTVVRNGDDIRLVVRSAADESSDQGGVLIVGEAADRDGQGIEGVTFADGTSWSKSDLISHVAYIGGGSGDDTVYGSDAVDEIHAGKGNDVLSGRKGGDVYIYRAGDGNDTIVENSDETGFDILKLADLNLADVRFERNGAYANSLTIRVLATNQTITLNDQFSKNGGVEKIVFADGTTLGGSSWTLDAILKSRSMILGNADANRIEGSDDDEAFLGLGGNDTLLGGKGSDRYIYASGDGSDIIDDSGNGASDIDVLALTDLNPSDVAIVQQDENAVLTVLSTGETITLVGQFSTSNATAGIENIVFANGVTWNRATFASLAAIQGTDGNDSLTGTSGRDTFHAGLGDDTIAGLRGSDTYLYGAGDGADTVVEVGNFDSAVDKLIISGYTSSQAVFTRMTDGGGNLTNNVRLTFADSATDFIDIGSISQSNGDGTGLELIQFSDRSYTRDQLQALVIGNAETSGNDIVYGFNSNNILQGGLGDDTLYGRQGTDTYIYSAGDGADVIVEDGNNDNATDTLVVNNYTSSEAIFTRINDAGGNRTDTVAITFAGSSTDSINVGKITQRYGDGTGLELIQFSDRSYTRDQLQQLIVTSGSTAGNDIIYGFNGSETLQGGLGNDLLDGGDGSDTYIYAAGDGADILADSGQLDGGTDKLVITGYTSSQAIFTYIRDGAGILTGNILVTFMGSTTDSINIGAVTDSWGSGLEQIVFSDVTYSRSQIASHAWINGTGGDDTIVGTSGSDSIDGLAGNDTISGGDGDDLIVGGAGDDVISGGNGNDTLRLSGTQSDYSFVRQSDNSILVTSLVGIDGTDVLTGVESVLFAGNDAKVSVSSLAPASGTSGTDGDDILVGSADPDTLNGKKGNDTLSGGKGADTYTFAPGDGADIILEGGQSLAAGISTGEAVYSADRKYQLIVQPDGNVVLYHGTYAVWALGSSDIVSVQLQSDGNLVFKNANGTVKAQTNTSGNPGATVVIANDGSFTVQSASGTPLWSNNSAHDGSRAVTAFSYSEIDTLDLTGYLPGDIVIKRVMDGSGNATHNAILSIAGTNDTINIGDVDDQNGAGLEAIHFSNGVTWSRDQIRAAVTIAGTSGADQLSGTSGGDTFAIGVGGDTLAGGVGSDTYVFKAGNGAATILEQGASMSLGLKQGESIYSPDGKYRMTLQQDGNFVVYHGTYPVWATGTGQDTALAQIYADGNWKLTKPDGTITGQTATGGNAGAQVLLSNDGSVSVVTTSGAVIWSSNTAHDNGRAVTPMSYDGDNDKLVLPDYASTSAKLTRVLDTFGNATDMVVITFAGSSDAINIGSVDDANGAGVESIEFSDTTWTKAQIRAAVQIQGGTGGDVLKGTSGSDILLAGTGNDSLSGGTGSDTYIFKAGDGVDTIVEAAMSFAMGLRQGDSLYSPDRTYRVTLQTDGNLVVYHGTTAIWATGTGQDTTLAKLWENGNFTLTKPDGTITGQTGTGGNPGATFLVENDGNLILRSASGSTLWQSNSGASRSSVTPFAQSGDNDTLVLIDYAASSANLTRELDGSGNATGNIILGFTGSTDKVNLGNIEDANGAGIDTLQFSNDLTWNRAQMVANIQATLPPVILDLDGDGVHIIASSLTSARFDMNSDGLKDITDWVSAGDGILAFDRNGDGLIANGSEISFIGDLTGAATDLEGLRAYDSNGNNQLDMLDASWNDFVVWRDTNQDGVSQHSELRQLSALGINSVGLNAGPGSGMEVGTGSEVIGVSTFAKNDGTVGEVADAVLAFTPSDKRADNEVVVNHIPLRPRNTRPNYGDLRDVTPAYAVLRKAGPMQQPSFVGIGDGVSAKLALAEAQRHRMIEAMAGFGGMGAGGVDFSPGTIRHDPLQLALPQTA